MDLRLTVVHGKPQGKEIPIHVSPFIIGRGPECHLRPNSDMVSRRHCALTIHGREVRIRDLGSTNGTIVDGERLTGELTLSDGDIVQVGVLAFQVIIRPDSPGQPHAASPKALPAAQPASVAKHTDNGDDVVQWLIGDSKHDVPASGSAVFGGKTVLTTGPIESTAPPGGGTDSAQASDDRAVQAVKGHGDRKGAEPKKKPVEASGAAAHAAEDMIRKFLERRPRG